MARKRLTEYKAKKLIYSALGKRYDGVSIDVSDLPAKPALKTQRALAKATKELKSNKESLELRKKTLEKQEGATKEKLNELQSKVQNALNVSNTESS